MKTLISLQKSLIPSCDVSTLDKLEELVRGTCEVPGVGALKIGAELGLEFGLRKVVDTIRSVTDLPIIYDHQKGGTDIPAFGKNFAQVLRRAKVDAAILFPFGGRVTEREWISYLQDEGLVVLVGGEMTQEGFLESDGGFIAHSAPEQIYRIAMESGVRDFVVPGNKPESVKRYSQMFQENLGAGNFTLYAPGFISQGGDISATGKVAGDRWHAIVGSALYKEEGVENIKRVALKLTSQLA
ncbi:MAG: orotidine 5'-phosphate decarboxylase / HUMPS family protein [Patescibacteria group bacterium]